MQQIATAQDISRLGTILCVWAHPDDETFTCAGIMTAAIRNGQTVVCVTATKGEKGVQDPARWPAERLGEIRAAELSEALQLMGCQNHHWLDCMDGDCSQLSDTEGSEKIRQFIDKYSPDTILTFGPDGMTGHPDHQAVSRWTALAAAGRAQLYYAVEEQQIYDDYMRDIDQQFNVYFNIDKPPLRDTADCDIALRLSPELCKIKESAFRAMPSQYDSFFATLTPEQVRAITCVECFVKA